MKKKKDNYVIALSFKQTEDDMEIYNWIAEHSNMSGFLKDILKKEMKRDKSN